MCCKQKVFMLLHVQQTLSLSNKLQNCKYCKNLRHSLKLCHQGVPKQLLCFRLIGSEYWNIIVWTTVSDSKLPFTFSVISVIFLIYDKISYGYNLKVSFINRSHFKTQNMIKAFNSLYFNCNESVHIYCLRIHFVSKWNKIAFKHSLYYLYYIIN